MKTKAGLILLLVSATLLVAIIGATFAYFSVSVRGNETATKVIVRTAQLSISYDSGEAIIAENILPGWSEEKEFSISSSSTIPVTYEVRWVEVLNQFNRKEDLTYKISGFREVVATPAPSDETVIFQQQIQPGEVHVYTLTISYAGHIDINQNEDQGKTFSARLFVDYVSHNN